MLCFGWCYPSWDTNFLTSFTSKTSLAFQLHQKDHGGRPLFFGGEPHGGPPSPKQKGQMLPSRTSKNQYITKLQVQYWRVMQRHRKMTVFKQILQVSIVQNKKERPIPSQTPLVCLFRTPMQTKQHWTHHIDKVSTFFGKITFLVDSAQEAGIALSNLTSKRWHTSALTHPRAGFHITQNSPEVSWPRPAELGQYLHNLPILSINTSQFWLLLSLWSSASCPLHLILSADQESSTSSGRPGSGGVSDHRLPVEREVTGKTERRKDGAEDSKKQKCEDTNCLEERGAIAHEEERRSEGKGGGKIERERERETWRSA